MLQKKIQNLQNILWEMVEETFYYFKLIYTHETKYSGQEKNALWDRGYD